MTSLRPSRFLHTVFPLVLLSSSAPAAMLSYYVAVDDLETIASGTYAGLPNPNHNRLTFLLSHPNAETPSNTHYHSKGTQIYTGPNNGAATAVITSPNSYLPEGVIPPLRLSPGAGVYSGALVTAPYTDSTDTAFHSSFLEIGNTVSLSGSAAGSLEAILFGSSAGRWDSPFDAADVHFELTSLTPGLNVGSSVAPMIGLVNPGDEFHLGEGSETFSFTPVFWTDAAALPGIYEARFRLTDESGVFGDSGEFIFRTQVVPEPSTAFLSCGVALVGLLHRRRVR